MVLAAKVAGPQDEGYAGARLLASILGKGPGSRLGRRLSGIPGLGFQASSQYIPLEGGPGVLLAWIGCSPKNKELAELILREEVTRLTVEPVSADELMTAREILRQDQILSLESHLKVSQRTARALQRGTPHHSSPPLVDALTLLEQARTSFHQAHVEGFFGSLASAQPKK